MSGKPKGATSRPRRIRSDPPHGFPRCPACSRSMSFSQPHGPEGDELLGVCTNDGCAEWIIIRPRPEIAAGWVIVRRIPASERWIGGDTWTVARPATAATAVR
jgi:hypothetical protein